MSYQELEFRTHIQSKKIVMPGLVPGMTVFACVHPNPSNQILFGDDFAKPAVIRNEFLDEFMDAVLEDIVHVAVLQAVADAAGVALRGALTAIGDPDLVES